jgi:zinc and cadmium transporter
MIYPAFLYGFSIFLAALIGGLLPLFISDKKENLLKLTVAFGAGLLLGMAFLHMVPEAAALAPGKFGYWFMGGFVLLLILERFVMVHACEETHCHYHTIGLAAFVGLTIHGVLEGFALGSTMYASGLAPLVLVAVLSHKIPAGFALTSILRMSTRTTRQIVLFVVGVALSGPLGLALSLGILEAKHMPVVSGCLLAMSAGSFIYIGACDLLPELHREDSEKLPRLACFMIGLAISALSTLVI